MGVREPGLLGDEAESPLAEGGVSVVTQEPDGRSQQRENESAAAGKHPVEDAVGPLSLAAQIDGSVVVGSYVPRPQVGRNCAHGTTLPSARRRPTAPPRRSTVPVPASHISSGEGPVSARDVAPVPDVDTRAVVPVVADVAGTAAAFDPLEELLETPEVAGELAPAAVEVVVVLEL